MRVLLTGAFGNVGSHTLGELVRQRHEVRCFDLPTRANRRLARRFTRGVTGVEVVWGDIRDAAAVAAAARDIGAVVHLAAVIPPTSEDRPDLARGVNVDGTRNVIAAATAAGASMLLASTLDVHGHTLSRQPPRHVDDPRVATDAYTEHKIMCEDLVRDSGLRWCILRFADVPVLGVRPAHPMMFEIGLRNRIESVHADDVALAVTNALATPAAWNRVLFIGGGPSCQLTYGQYLTTMVSAMGLKPLPENAFSDKEYATDWLDTEESQELLRYQRHTVNDIAAAIAASLGWRKVLMPILGPIARARILRMSPYARTR
jgi:UDP-glucose 4-epimerase